MFSVVGIGTACSSEDDPNEGNPSNSTGGVGTGTGGVSAGGGPAGGATGTGGVVSGTGGVATGGAISAGGGPASGGTTNTGGVSSGGVSSGGVSSGGVSSGGAPASGGNASSGGSSGATGETGRMVGMTAAHNAVRAGVQTSNPLPNVTWSPQVAQIAQAYAEQLASQGCNLVHSQRQGYGENLAYIGGGNDTAQRAVELWASEGQCYEFGPFLRGDTCTCPCQGNNCCGHYTQLVWRGTTTIGCGVAACARGGSVWVCNYQPPGNFVGQNPY